MIWRSDSAKSTFRNDGTLMMDIYIYISHTHAFIIYLFIYLFLFIFIIIFYIYFYLYLFTYLFTVYIYTHRYVDK